MLRPTHTTIPIEGHTLMVPFIPVAHFYDHYLVDHYLYKQTLLRNLIDGTPESRCQALNGVRDIIDPEFVISLKIEMHFSLLQAIESLFEMVFALEKKQPEALWRMLVSTKGKQTYDRMELVARGDTASLNEFVVHGDFVTCPLVQWIFFYGVTNWGARNVDKNLKTVERLLVSFASEFKDRSLYNAYKHGLRLVPGQIKSLSAQPVDGDGPSVTLDMGDGLTYLTESSDKIEQRTIAIDYERDYRMSVVCHMLLNNIFQVRRLEFGHREDADAKIYYFDDMNVDDVVAMSGDLATFTCSIEKPKPQRPKIAAKRQRLR